MYQRKTIPILNFTLPYLRDVESNTQVQRPTSVEDGTRVFLVRLAVLEGGRIERSLRDLVLLCEKRLRVQHV